MKFSELQARIGQVIGTSDWIDVSQARIDMFADGTGDHQLIHVDPEAAKATPFGQTIAHGFPGNSLQHPLIDQTLGDMEVSLKVNYGFNKVRFLCPVKSGKRVRGHFKLLELDEKRPGQWQQVLEATVEIEGEEKPALVAEWIMQAFE